jgi:hypothetical protein
MDTNFLEKISMDKNTLLLAGFIIVVIFLLTTHKSDNGLVRKAREYFKTTKNTNVLPDFSRISNNTVNFPPSKPYNAVKEEFANPRNSDFLPEMPPFVDNKIVPNFMYSVDFPENTSYELRATTSDYITDMYESNTISDLYDAANNDIFKGYKNNKYML